MLTTQVEAYKILAYPMESSHPIDTTEIRVADKGISRRQFCGMTGIPYGELSEVMSRKRPLNLNMIRSIGPLLDLPVEVLVQPYAVMRGHRVDA